MLDVETIAKLVNGGGDFSEGYCEGLSREEYYSKLTYYQGTNNRLGTDKKTAGDFKLSKIDLLARALGKVAEQKQRTNINF